MRLDELDRAVAVEAVGQELAQRVVADPARVAPEHRAVHGRTVPARGRRLGPAGVVGVPGLSSDERRPVGEEVVRRGERPAAGQRDALALERITDERHPERVPQQLRDVACARDVAGLVEPVRVLEVRVGQTELARLRVHQREKRSTEPCPTWRASASAASFALGTSSRAQELLDRQLLASLEIDRRLADSRGPRVHAHYVAEACVLEDDDRRS